LNISYGSILGVSIAIAAIGFALSEYEISFFLNGQAALIVIGGTLAATMISFEGKEVFRALGAMREIVIPSSIDDESMMSEVQIVVAGGKLTPEKVS